MNFEKYLKNIEYPKQKSSWNIAGTLQNGFYKFDTRPIQDNSKVCSFNTKADKIVFYIDNKYIVVDTKELITYLKKNKIKDVHLQNVLLNLEWNIIIND